MTSVSEAAPTNAPGASIWRNRDFTVVLFGQGISNLGDAVRATVLPLLVLALTGSGAQMGLVGALGMLPHLFFGLPAGALADRWDRRRVMLLCDLGRALLTGLIPLAMLVDIPVMPVIYGVALPLSMLSILFGAAYSAAVPTLVGRRQIGQASSYFEALESASWIIGPGVAGLLVTWVGAGPVLALDALSFLGSALALRLVRRRLQIDHGRPPSALLHEIWEGISWIWRDAVLRALVAYRSVASLLTAAFIPALTYALTAEQGRPASQVGLAIAVYAAGSLGGTLLAGRLAGRLGLSMLLGVAAMGAALLLLGLAQLLGLALAAAALFGLAEGFVLVLYLTVRATATPDALLGRVTSTFSTLILGCGALGLLGGGLLLDAIGGGATLALLGGLLAAVGLGFLLSRSLRDARASDGAAEDALT